MSRVAQRDVEHMRVLKEAGFSRAGVALLTGYTHTAVGDKVGRFPWRNPASLLGLRRGEWVVVRATGRCGHVLRVLHGPAGRPVARLALTDGRNVLEYADDSHLLAAWRPSRGAAATAGDGR